MSRVVRDVTGSVCVLVALVALYGGVAELRDHDYLGAALLLVAGLAVLRSAVELLRPTVGE